MGKAHAIIFAFTAEFLWQKAYGTMPRKQKAISEAKQMMEYMLSLQEESMAMP